MRKARHGTKIYEQCQVPKERAQVNNLVKWGPWVVAQIYKASKLPFSDINRNRRLGLSSRRPCAGVATGLLKTPKTQLKNDTALIPVLNTFKITTFPHLEHRSNMTDYSFYNCIRYQNAKTKQSV